MRRFSLLISVLLFLTMMSCQTLTESNDENESKLIKTRGIEYNANSGGSEGGGGHYQAPISKSVIKLVIYTLYVICLSFAIYFYLYKYNLPCISNTADCGCLY